jgi:peptidoglycan-N-acetylmuramic acid deacetylase
MFAFYLLRNPRVLEEFIIFGAESQRILSAYPRVYKIKHYPTSFQCRPFPQPHNHDNSALKVTPKGFLYIPSMPSATSQQNRTIGCSLKEEVLMKFTRLICITFITFLFLSQAHISYAQKEVSNERLEWYFKKSGSEKPPTTEENYLKLVKNYDSLFLGDPNKKDIYLTFDNGYENGYTDDVLDVLKRKKVPAAFFVTGQFMKTHPHLIKRMAKEGHIVGNHSFHHPDLTQVDDQRLKKELELVKMRYAEITGHKDMQYLRPPRGVFSERTIALAKKEGYTHVFWSLAFLDWETNKQRGWRYSYNQIMKQIHPGSILLLHTVSKDNAEALETTIDALQKRGYTFKSLDELQVKKDTPSILINP